MTSNQQPTSPLFNTVERVALLIAQQTDDNMSVSIKRVVAGERIDRMMSGRPCDNISLVHDTIDATRDAMAVQIAGMVLLAEGKGENIERVDTDGPDPSTFDVATLRAVLDYVSHIPSNELFAALDTLSSRD